jgi:hypothetical protein
VLSGGHPNLFKYGHFEQRNEYRYQNVCGRELVVKGPNAAKERLKCGHRTKIGFEMDSEIISEALLQQVYRTKTTQKLLNLALAGRESCLEQATVQQVFYISTY